MLDIKGVNERTDLDEWLAERHLNGHWNGMGERAKFTPYVWRWDDIYTGLMKAAEVVPMDDTGRRTIQLRVPSLGDRMSNTIHMSVQCVMPGEIAKAHRHIAAAVRFVLKGQPGCDTVVEGEPFAMREGDLVTTPNWTWHDHYNRSDEPMIWLDGLDVRLASIGKMLGEEFSQDTQPIEKPAGYSAQAMGRARPSWLKSEHPTPPFRYPWEETYATLMTLKAQETEGDPHDGIRLLYTHPLNGGPTLPTFACELQLLQPKQQTASHRHICTTIYQVFRGAGSTTVDGEKLEWSQGDIFVVPPWTWHSHENRVDQDTILYSMSDWPAMTALGLFREEDAPA